MGMCHVSKGNHVYFCQFNWRKIDESNIFVFTHKKYIIYDTK